MPFKSLELLVFAIFVMFWDCINKTYFRQKNYLFKIKKCGPFNIQMILEQMNYKHWYSNLEGPNSPALKYQVFQL